ncbi:C39 family peptidase [Fundicoccus sp. Sow4_D5]|uniref:C39 family peptidase n=1 Tax=Fundicoccus sp. Sow4_D5 TaxID=3438782 RepID=UPI003F933765
MNKDRKPRKNKYKTIRSVAVVLLLFTVLILGVWRLVSDGLVTDRLNVIDDVVEQLPVSEESMTEEATLATSTRVDIQARDDLDRMALYKGINQYKQTGFIPLFIYNMKPAENILLKGVEQINVPLMNQKDFRWAFDTYGDDSGSIIAANGCAVVSLAMVDSYFQNETIDPGEIADWAGLDHYVTYAGTAFTIYEAFGKERGYKVKEFYDFHEAMEEVEAGNPVVVGINPGYFSSIGHVMVIRGYEDGMVYINDPNDDATSQASLVGHDEEYMIQDGIAYWSFSK